MKTSILRRALMLALGSAFALPAVASVRDGDAIRIDCTASAGHASCSLDPRCSQYRRSQPRCP